VALRHLGLRDFVIVRTLALDLDPGMTVLTGETGAGKSILIDALQLVLGHRADPAVVREGAARCEICAEFDTPDALRPWLDAQGFEAADSLLLRRTIDSAGKSRAWINGSAATATQLREAGEYLVDIHGQHAWQSLTRADAVRELLDAYAGLDRQPMQQAWQRWRQAHQTWQQAQAAQATLETERERLAWQLGELGKLAPQADEWADLNARHQRLTHAQSLIEAAQLAGQQLSSDEDDGGVLRSLSQAIHRLQEQAHVEPEFVALSDVLASAQAQIEDVAHSLHGYLRRTELDPEGLAELDERVGQWLSLARRHKRPPEELPALWQSWQDELARLDQAADLDGLQRAEQQARAAYEQQAQAVSAQRRKAAPRLSKAVSAAMQQLGMAGGRFEVALSALPEPASHGLDEVVFLVAGHAGSTPRPVAKVASGGELSRIALAIAVTTSELGQADTLIFDEVDSGVGGAVADTVGRLMQQLGQHRQVLAVTHLPQVAACADQHLLVRKQAQDGGVSSQVEAIADETRVQEIARMLGGERASAAGLAHAREMLGHGRR